MKYAAFLILMHIGLAANSQDSVRFSTIHFFGGAQVAVPSREFREVINNSFGNLGYGLNFGLVLSPLGEKKPSPVLLGADFGFFTYGNEKQKGNSGTPPLKTTHNVFTWNGMARLKPKHDKGRVIPFADGLLGLKLFNSKTKIDKDVTDIIFNTDQREVINNVKDTGLNYGLGLGFYTNPKKTTHPGFQLRVLYLWGDEVKYVVRNSVKMDNNGFVTYQTDRANTTMVIVQLNFTALALKTLVGSY
ncbi:MAG: hypothetical protein KIT62_12025 [Cyclobacteriaceae bacterium]|nr:hypothetical protein [Cyclobacteriaceae bacterium]